MKTVKILTILLLALGLMFLQAEVSNAEPMGTAWTYQGRLLDANGPSDGMYDFQFKLYDNANVIDGNQVGADVNVPDVDVIDGYFTVVLEFGCDVFNGDARWLEIEVRQADSNDPNDFITLSPRQEVTPTPYALQTRGIFVDGIENVGIGTDIPFERLEVDNGNLLVRGIGSFDSDDEEAFVYLGDNNHYIKSGWGFGVSIGTWEVDPGIVVRETTGHVGIGTIDPQKNLSIQATRPQIALVENGGDAGILEFHEQENQLRLQYWTDYGSTWNTTMMTLDGDTGNVGIGTSNPDKFLTLEKQGQAGSAPQIKIKGYYDGSGSGSYLVMGKSRGSTVGDNQTTANGDTLGLIDTFGINYLDNEATATRMMFKQDGLSFSPYIPARIEFYTSDGGSAAAERMRIDKDGKVGIGTTNPEVELHVQGDARVSDDLWVQDSLTVSGPRIGTFPRPAYDSGWVGVFPGTATTLTHNLAGVGYNDVNDYVVDLQFKDIENYGINNVAIGSEGTLDHDHNHDEFPSYHYSYRGACWTNLTTSTIKIVRAAEDAEADGIRIRIWVYK